MLDLCETYKWKQYYDICSLYAINIKNMPKPNNFVHPVYNEIRSDGITILGPPSIFEP